MAVKRDKFDDVFSQCVRFNANWTCERCGIVDVDGVNTGRSYAMHCSHIFGRRNLATRWHPDNCVCLCAGCHKALGDDPIMHAAFARQRLGEVRYEALICLARSVYKWTKAEKHSMYIHYKHELERMRQAGFVDYAAKLVGYQ